MELGRGKRMTKLRGQKGTCTADFSHHWSKLSNACCLFCDHKYLIDFAKKGQGVEGSERDLHNGLLAPLGKTNKQTKTIQKKKTLTNTWSLLQPYMILMIAQSHINLTLGLLETWEVFNTGRLWTNQEGLIQSLLELACLLILQDGSAQYFGINKEYMDFLGEGEGEGLLTITESFANKINWRINNRVYQLKLHGKGGKYSLRELYMYW